MNHLEDIVAHSSFQLAGTYVWASVRAARNPEKHLLMTRDEKEITVVTTAENLDDLDVVSIHPDRWQLLSIDCANPFECVGCIATIAAPFRSAGIDILCEGVRRQPTTNNKQHPLSARWLLPVPALPVP